MTISLNQIAVEEVPGPRHVVDVQRPDRGGVHDYRLEAIGSGAQAREIRRQLVHAFDPGPAPARTRQISTPTPAAVTVNGRHQQHDHRRPAGPVAPVRTPRGRWRRTGFTCSAACRPPREWRFTGATPFTEAEEIEDVPATLFGWSAQVGYPGLTVGVLTNRLRRTAIQVSESDEEEPPPGRDAAFATVTTAVYAVSAQLAAHQGAWKLFVACWLRHAVARCRVAVPVAGAGRSGHGADERQRQCGHRRAARGGGFGSLLAKCQVGSALAAVRDGAPGVQRPPHTCPTDRGYRSRVCQTTVPVDVAPVSRTSRHPLGSVRTFRRSRPSKPRHRPGPARSRHPTGVRRHGAVGVPARSLVFAAPGCRGPMAVMPARRTSPS